MTGSEGEREKDGCSLSASSYSCRATADNSLFLSGLSNDEAEKACLLLRKQNNIMEREKSDDVDIPPWMFARVVVVVVVRMGSCHLI